MRVSGASSGHRPRRWYVLTGLAFAIAVSAAQAQPAGEPITVHLDSAKVLKLPERTTTLVVGNPLIADAAVQAGNILVITGKSYGATNLVALDRSGAVLMEHPIQVLAPRDHIVVVHRGAERESYSCAPTCERRIVLGDTTDYFIANLSNTTTLNNQAQGGSHK
jgi:Flp pilus assembly secretin CpaC